MVGVKGVKFAGLYHLLAQVMKWFPKWAANKVFKEKEILKKCQANLT